jgi:hypothetical protein
VRREVHERDPERPDRTGRFLEKRFEFKADFTGLVACFPTTTPPGSSSESVNLDGFETVSVQFPAFEVGSQRLDELARWIVGEPNGFLRGGQNLRRVEY